MKYDVFLSDFDGTLVKADGTISENTKKAIARYREKGGIFAVCTGRGLTAIAPRMQELGITQGVLVSFQGAVITDIATGNTLKYHAFPLQDALEIIRFFEEMGAHVQTYTLADFYSNMNDSLLAYYEEVCRVKATLPKEPLSVITEREQMQIIKILLMEEAEKCEELLKVAQRQFGERFFVTRSADYLVELLPKGQNKGEAVKFLAEYYRVPVSKIAAAGDQLNDLPMLEAAGGKFTVKNGAKELKKIAVELPSNEEDGVAAALNEITKGD